MKTKKSASDQMQQLSKEQALALTKINKGIQRCVHEVHHAMPVLFGIHPQLKLFHAVQKKICNQSEKLSIEALHFQITQAFISMLMHSKIEINQINQIYPNRLLSLLNQHLSKTFIYDQNCHLYDKPHTSMSMHLLAQFLGCTRNQLNYRQSQIDQAFKLKWSALQAKCEALQHDYLDSAMLWRAEHE